MSSLMVAIPFLVVQFVPVADLPQHVAQIRLFFEALGNDSGHYRIQWLAPGGLAYAILAFLWAVLPPLDVGRAFFIVIGIGWTCATFLLAVRRGRSTGAAILASAFFFNHALYWGFIGFLVGWPVFVGWMLLTLRVEDRGLSGRTTATACMLSVLLHYSHPMWLVAGLVWMVALRVTGRRSSLRYAACLLPGVALSTVWYSTAGMRAIQQTAYWPQNTIQRLNPAWLADAALGGLSSDTETMMLLIAVAWIGVGFWHHRRGLRDSVDTPLLVAAAVFLVATLALPQFYDLSLRVAERWMPIATILALLGGPSPVISIARSWAVGLALLAVFALSTTGLWSVFQSVEMTGLDTAVDALPADRRVLGLDFIKTSSIVTNRPFLHAYVYGQVAKGGSVYNSFAGTGQNLVAFASPASKAWTPGLDWNSHMVKPSDFDEFDYVILNGNDAIHRMWAKSPRLEPVTSSGQFRLYKIVPGGRTD